MTHAKRKPDLKKRITTLQNKLDRLIQKHYVPLNPYCEVCGQPTAEMHHYVQKSQSLYLRYHPKNLIPLCKKCHCRHHQAGDPNIVATIVRKRGKKWLDWIQAHRNIIVKRNLEYYGQLQELAKKLTN